MGPRQALRGHRVDGLGSLPHTPAPSFLLAQAPGGGRPRALCSVAGNASCSRNTQPGRPAQAHLWFPALICTAGVPLAPPGVPELLLWCWAEHTPPGPLGPHGGVTQSQGGDSRGQHEAAGRGWGPGAEART